MNVHQLVHRINAVNGELPADHVEEARGRIKTGDLNVAAYALMALVTCVGLYFYYLTSSPWIIYPAFLEVAGFYAVIVMNNTHHKFLAHVTLFGVNVLFAVYWSCMLGDGISIDLIVAFLTILIFHQAVTLNQHKEKERKILRVCVGGTVLLLIALLLNTHFKFIPAIPMKEDIALVMRWITAVCLIIFMLVIMFFFYASRINAFVASEEKHTAALQAQTIFLRESFHELRTPLNGVFGIAQLLQLKKGRFEREEAGEIDDLFTATYTARNIINNVLDISKIEAGQFNEINKESFNLRECIAHSVKINSYVAGSRDIFIKFSYNEGFSDYIFSDRIIITKIVNNLLSNAVKFAPAESTIQLNVYAEGQQLLMIVENKGCIGEEKATRLFQPFMSERNSHFEGTGLGLSITKHLVDLLSGEIKVNGDELLNKTVFTLSLPLELVPKARDTSTPAETHRNAFPGLTAVVVDDDALSRSVVKKMLHIMGIRSIPYETVEDGFQGILRDRPDVIISDLHLGAGNQGGRELLQQVRIAPELKDIPVIIVSGDAFSAASNEMIRAGANAFQTKPVLLSELYTTLLDHLPADKIGKRKSD